MLKALIRKGEQEVMEKIINGITVLDLAEVLWYEDQVWKKGIPKKTFEDISDRDREEFLILATTAVKYCSEHLEIITSE